MSTAWSDQLIAWLGTEERLLEAALLLLGDNWTREALMDLIKPIVPPGRHLKNEEDHG